jgi:large conductance mechanosensitive channel
MKQLFNEFREFLKEYKIVGLAIAFIMGVAATSLIKSFVDSIIMPLLSPILPGAEWQAAVWNLGPVALGIGAFISACINFLIIALVVFLIAKFFLKEEKVNKK